MDHKTRAGYATTGLAIGLGLIIFLGVFLNYENFARHYAYELQDDNRPVIEPVNATSAAGGMQRVFLIIIEGGRADALADEVLAPNIANFTLNSTRLGQCSAQFPTFLKTAVVSIYTGAAPYTHPYLVDTQTVPEQVPCETLFKVASRQAGGETMFCGDPKWRTLFAPYIDYAFTDLASFFTQYVVGQPCLAAVHLNATDVAGWAYGGNSEEYANAVRLVDTQVGFILQNLTVSGLLNETLVVLTTTSGHVNALQNGGGGNGGEEVVVTTTYACFSGNGVNRAGWCNQTAHLEDLAPTISYLMSWPLPTHSNGEVLYETLNVTAPGAITPQRNASMAIQMAERALGLLNATGKVLRIERSLEKIANFTARLDALKSQMMAASTDGAFESIIATAIVLQQDLEVIQDLWVEERVFKERFARFIGIVAVIFLIFVVSLRIIKNHRFVIEKGQIALGFMNAGILSGLMWLLYWIWGDYFSFSTAYALVEPPLYPLLVASGVLLAAGPPLLAWTRVMFIQRNGYEPENDFTAASSIFVILNHILILPFSIIYGTKPTFDFPGAWVIFPGYLPALLAIFMLLLTPAFFGIKRLWDRFLRRFVKPKFEHVIDSREHWHIISRDEKAILEYRRRIMATAAAVREMEAKANNNDPNANSDQL